MKPTEKASFRPPPLQASPSVLEGLSRHLALSQAPGCKGARLVTVALEGADMLLFAFQGENGENVRLGMTAVGGDPWAFNGRTIKLCYHLAGKTATGLECRVLERLGARFDGAPFERLAKVVRGKTTALPKVKDGETMGPTTSDWAHPDQWREFSFFSAIEWCAFETFLGHRAIANTSSAVRYGDIECQTSQCFVASTPQTPWAFFRESLDGSPEHLVMMDEQDVVHGTGVTKLERVLDSLEGDPSCRSLQFFNCCVPMMTGDDVRTPLSRFQKRTGWKVVFTDMSPLNNANESVSREIKKELSSGKTAPSPASRRRYNLAGFRATRGRGELVALLSQAGAELNLALLPAYDLESMKKYGDAAAQAFMPNRYYQDVYDVLDGLGPRTLKDCAPYGKKGTTQWLRGLTELLGNPVATGMEARLSEFNKDFTLRWESAVARARAHRIAIVAGPDDVPHLMDPDRLGGAVIPALLTEMGFGIDILAFNKDLQAPADAARRLLAGLPDAERHTVLDFSDPAGLLEHFRSGRFSLVYSNIRNDRRLTRNGLLGFSLADLEMGFSGALRTLTKLLERCEVPFFRENSRHLREL